MTGKQIKNTNIAYIRRNAPPPFFAAPTGKPTKFPMPTAEPAAARMNPNREPNSSLEAAIMLSFLSFIIIFGSTP
jgi:hypothetical protein